MSRIWSWVYQPQYGRVWPVSGSVPASPAGIRQPPTSISFGYFGISIRQPWSSVRCQCSTLSLCRAIASISCLISSTDWKCRAESSISPRQEKRGASSIRSAGIRTASPWAEDSSCHSVTAP